MFTTHTPDTAPAESAQVLKGVQEKMGFVPNLFAHIAESPTATKAYAQLSELLGQSSLSPQELQIALLATSVENRCHFCVAAHTAGGTKAKVSQQTLDAIRSETAPDDAKDAALVQFVRRVVRDRGWVPESEVKAFVDAGYSEAQILDVITAVALKTLSNYSNHLTNPALNPELEKFTWEPEAKQSKVG
ncbi:MAG: carboxymuconolactone decarboxylase family protein [Gammaproteobacteria bacterium]|nr:carboxymuconolactone decarboxylase family protein [Gammaproteobacteria bacterium]